LDAMEERQVTVDGITHMLPRPFMVLATQNPIEYEGTFPLPEAQLDRFILRVKLGYPQAQEEIDVLERQQYRHPIEVLEQVASPEDLLEAQETVKKVFVAPALKRYIVEITRRTRDYPEVYLGASPRGSLTLYRAGQARAAMQGRNFVLPDDVKALADSALSHRVILGPAARLRDLSASQIVGEVLSSVAVPGGDLTGEE
jgi:MoxR-like ATPase